jgi:hypothetical protein
MSCGADKNNGLGEAFSGSSATAAEHRGKMVSSTSLPAVRIVSPQRPGYDRKSSCPLQLGEGRLDETFGIGPTLDHPNQSRQRGLALRTADRTQRNPQER